MSKFFPEFEVIRNAIRAMIPSREILDGHETVPDLTESKCPSIRWLMMLDGHEYVVAMLPRITVEEFKSPDEILPPHVQSHKTRGLA